MPDSKFKTFFLYFSFFVYFAGAPSVLAGSNVLLFLCTLYTGFCAFSDKRKFDWIIIIPLVLFAIINIISIFRFGNGIDLQAYIGYNLRYLFAYFILKYLSNNFLHFFCRAIYLSAIISIPFYLIQLIDVDFFYNNFKVINLAIPTNIVSRHNWGCIVFNSFPLLSGFVRNSGFTSEPSYFGFYIGLCIVLELFKSGFKLNKRIILLFIVGLTTFSTTYYVIIGLIMILIFFNRSGGYRIVMAILIAIASFTFITASFGLDKINNIHEITTSRLDYDVYSEDVLLSRMDNLNLTYVNLNRSIFGLGMNSNALYKNKSGNVIIATGGLFNYITQWGIVFIIFFPLLLYNFWKTVRPSLNNISTLILILMSLLWMFSSIDHKDPLLFIICMIGIMKYVPTRDVRYVIKR